MRVSSPLLLREQPTPANPPSGSSLLYVKSDGKVYTKRGTTEVLVGPYSAPSNLVTTDGTQTITGAKTLSSASNSFTGSGAGLTNLNADRLVSGAVPLAQSIAPVNSNLLRANLGVPSATEMALIDGAMTNKLLFKLPESIELSNDSGATWVPHSKAPGSDTVKNMVLGRYVNGSYLAFTPTQQLRLTFAKWSSDWASSYVYLNLLYLYLSTAGNNAKVVIEHSLDGTTWSTRSDTNTASGWPGHFVVSHSTIPWHNNPTPGTHYQYVRFTLIVPTPANTNMLYLYHMDWWGGYPAASRDIPTYDFDRNVTFPAAVNALSLNPTNALTQAKTHASPDTDASATALHHTLGSGANQAAAGDHAHAAPSNMVTTDTAQTITGAKNIPDLTVTDLKLPIDGLDQSETHGNSDTDFATTSLHHTLGTGANQAAAGNHGHVAADVTSGVFATARLGTGAASSTTFLRGDGTWASSGAQIVADAASRPAHVDGLLIYQVDTEAFYVSQGGSWLLLSVRECLTRIAKGSTAQTVPNSSETVVTFQSVSRDTHSAAEIANNRIVCKVAGDYSLGAGGHFVQSNSGHRRLAIYVNGVYMVGDIGHGGGSGGTSVTLSPSIGATALAAGDTVELRAYQNSGAGLDLNNAGRPGTNLWIQRTG